MRNRRRGSAFLEFTLLGIPMIFLFTSAISCAIDMWQFYTLSYAVEATARYASMHGATCASPNTCTITVGNVMTFFKGQAYALDPAKTTLVLTDASGSTTGSHVSDYLSNGTQFPAATANANKVNKSITLKASYTLVSPIAMFWPGGSGNRAGTFTVAATSIQRIAF
jgi:Flp pilus assembly protein TadG